MRPCGSHRPPLRFFNLASSASSSFIFRFLRDGDVGVCSPSRRVFLIAVPLVMEKGPFYVAQGPQEGGRGGSSISCFSFVGFFLFVPSFFVCGCMHGPPVLARPHLTNRRGHTHGGGHGPISSSFSWLSSCPAPKSAHQKVQKSSFMTPFYMQRHNKTKCIYDSLFSPISYGFKAADVLFCLCIFIFLTLINLHAMYVSLVNLFKLPVACFVRPAPLWRSARVGVPRASYA